MQNHPWVTKNEIACMVFLRKSWASQYIWQFFSTCHHFWKERSISYLTDCNLEKAVQKIGWKLMINLIQQPPIYTSNHCKLVHWGHMYLYIFCLLHFCCIRLSSLLLTKKGSSAIVMITASCTKIFMKQRVEE